jgi:hypothetical protein
VFRPHGWALRGPPLFEASNPHSRLFYFQDFIELVEKNAYLQAHKGTA